MWVRVWRWWVCQGLWLRWWWWGGFRFGVGGLWVVGQGFGLVALWVEVGYGSIVGFGLVVT